MLVMFGEQARGNKMATLLVIGFVVVTLVNVVILNNGGANA